MAKILIKNQKNKTKLETANTKVVIAYFLKEVFDRVKNDAIKTKGPTLQDLQKEINSIKEEIKTL